MLTPKQIEDARKKLGIDSSNPQRSTGNNLLQRLESPEEPTFLGKVARETLRPFAKAGTSLINTAQIATGQEETQPFSGEYLGEVERIGKGFDVTKGFDEENVKALKDAAKTGVDIGLLISGGGGTTGALKTGVKEGILKGAKELGKTGAIIGGASGASTGLEEGATLGSTLKNTVVGAGVGLATGSVLGVVPGGIRAGTQVVKKVGTGVRKVGQDIIPSSERLVNSQVSKALDLTQGDIKNIASSTGNEVGEFLAKHNLIGGNKDETVKLLNDFYSKNYNKVRDEISKVKKTYTNTDIPRFKQSLLEIKKQVSDVSGLEDVSKEVDTLLKKKSISLNDIQRTKELLDEHFSLYKMTGDVKEGATKSGLSNIRKELKEFIEKEVKDVSGNDIGALNNSVSTSRSTLDAIETRSTRGLTRSNIKIGDLGIFGVGAAIGSPILGLGAVVAKKIIESPSIRLKIAKFLDKLNDASRKKIQDQLLKGVMPVEIEKIVSQSSFTPKAQTKKIITQKTSISPNSTTKSLKGKGVIPKHLEPLAVEARKGDYLYHGTGGTSAEAIMKEGLKPGRKGTLSLSKDEAYSKSYAQDGITPQGKTYGTMFRVKADYLKGKTVPVKKTAPMSDQLNEILTKENIPPEAIEVFKNGKWQPLKVDPLIAEARKYKSAEVAPKIYHATTEQNVSSINQMGIRSDINKMYFASNESIAKGYGKGIIALNENHFQVLPSTSPKALKLFKEAGINPDYPMLNDKLIKLLKADGYDGLKYPTDNSNWDFEIFNKEKIIKSLKSNTKK